MCLVCLTVCSVFYFTTGKGKKIGMETKEEKAFEERKETALRAARAQGISDIVQGSENNGVSLETLELATRLTKKHAPALYEKLEKRRHSQ